MGIEPETIAVGRKARRRTNLRRFGTTDQKIEGERRDALSRNHFGRR